MTAGLTQMARLLYISKGQASAYKYTSTYRAIDHCLTYPLQKSIIDDFVGRSHSS